MNGFVYILYDGESRLCKIGHTCNMANRMEVFYRRHKKSKLFMVFETQNYVQLENQLHKLYKGERVRGEWFFLNAKRLHQIRCLGMIDKSRIKARDDLCTKSIRLMRRRQLDKFISHN